MMLFNILPWMSLLAAFNCLPEQRIRLPDLNFLPPENVNSLEVEEPQAAASQNIESTVKEVEDLIKANPKLPRLTRGEILDILENITVTDSQKRNGKAIMVVMPFTPSKGDDKNMEELYTKPPVTHMIGQEEPTVKKAPGKTKKRPFESTTRNVLEFEEYPELVSSTTKRPIRRRRPSLTTSTTTTSTTTTERATTTQRPKVYSTSKKPLRRRSTTTVSTVTKHPNHRYPEELINNEGIRIIESPKLSTKEVPSTRNPEPVFTNPQIYEKKKQPLESASLIVPHQDNFKPIVPTSTTSQAGISEIVPGNLKKVVQDLDLDTAMDPKPSPISFPTLKEQHKLLSVLGIDEPTTEVPDAESVAENLSPEMRNLLVSFGLIPDQNPTPKPQPDFYNPEKAEIDPESYAGFKPLPEEGSSRNDMEELLASFGLGRSARKNKAIKYDSAQKLNFDVIPEDLRHVVSDLGFDESRRNEKKIRTSTNNSKQHVFNPDEQYATQEELKKLEELLGMIKQLEKLNGTATEEDFKKINLTNLKELVGSLNTDPTITLDDKEKFGPNPNNFGDQNQKNEVKRQEATTVTAVTSTESQNAPISELEASFGGSSTVEPSSAPQVETTTAIRTGFYYLVDWNSFLDIDDTKGRRVNLRFQPKIGDPKRFLSVTEA